MEPSEGESNGIADSWNRSSTSVYGSDRSVPGRRQGHSEDTHRFPEEALAGDVVE